MSSRSADRLTAELASQFARIALGHVAREYPNKLDHVLTGSQDVRGPRDLHPIFFGSFDWHSCVHGYWTLAVVLRLYPELPEAAAIRALFDQAFTDENVAVEAAYLDRPASRGFERPYGWAWLLKLQTELMAHDATWSAMLKPLAARFIERFQAFLPFAAYPIRTGTHSSTAFALTLACEAFSTDLRERARGCVEQWYLGDRDAQAWEPSLDDFLSPTLMEAHCVATLLDERRFRTWFDAFLPRLTSREPRSLFLPAASPDRSDGKMAHLDGVNLSRAWCWRSIARRLAAGDPRRAIIEETAREHLAASLPYVAGDYMGEHWLASFALLALTAG